MLLATIAQQRQAWLDSMHWVAGPAFIIGVVFISGWMLGGKRR